MKRAVATLPPTLPTFDPREVWASLPPATRDLIGAATIAQFAAELGNGEFPLAGDAWDNAAAESRSLIEAALDDAMWEAPEGVLPDMNALGVRTCVACGCTDDHACEDVCDWASLDPPRCTNCVPAGGSR